MLRIANNHEVINQPNIMANDIRYLKLGYAQAGEEILPIKQLDADSISVLIKNVDDRYALLEILLHIEKLDNDKKHLLFQTIIELSETNGLDYTIEWIRNCAVKNEFKKIVSILNAAAKNHILLHLAEYITGRHTDYAVQQRCYHSKRESILSDCNILIGLLKMKIGAGIINPEDLLSVLSIVIEIGITKHVLNKSDKYTIFKSITKNNSSIKDVQGLLLILLREFDSICTRESLPYAITSSTLTDYVQYGGLGPTAKSVQVMMIRKNYLLLKEAIKKSNLIKIVEFSYKKEYITRAIFKDISGSLTYITIIKMDYVDNKPEHITKMLKIKKDVSMQLSTIKTQQIRINDKDVLSVYNELKKQKLEEIDETDYIMKGPEHLKSDNTVYKIATVFPTNRVKFESIDVNIPHNFVINTQNDTIKKQLMDIAKSTDHQLENAVHYRLFTFINE